MPDRPERRLSLTRARMPLVARCATAPRSADGCRVREVPQVQQQPPEGLGLRLLAHDLHPGAMKDTKRAKRVDDHHLHAVRARARQDGRLPPWGRPPLGAPLRRAPKRSLRNRKACTLYAASAPITRWRLKAGKVEIVLQRAAPWPRAAQRPLPRHDRGHRSQRHHRSVPKTARFAIGVRHAGAAPAPTPRPHPRLPVRAGPSAGTSAPARRRSPARPPPSRRSPPRRPGAVICLANGTYGKLALSARRPREVTVQSAPPAVTTIAGASLTGAN